MKTKPGVVHHNFEFSKEEFEKRKAWPIKPQVTPVLDWEGEYASQSPLNQMHIATEGGGAEGTASYLALVGTNSDQFYAEATPRWYRPRVALDLRNTRTRFYLKAIKPVTVANGYHPYLFIDDFDDVTNTYCGWYLSKPLRVGKDWTPNDLALRNDESLWTRYSSDRPLDTVLGRVGFIGVMYLRGIEYKGVNANGILGIDEFRYNLPL